MSPVSKELEGVVQDLRRYLQWEVEQGREVILKARTKPEPASAALPPPADVGAKSPRTLQEIRKELGDCQRCKLAKGRTKIVFGVGNPKARLVFVGEGPGAEEDTQGLPFVGAAGQLLDKMIAAMGYGRDEVYICNVVKCRPPENRTPRPEEALACSRFLVPQLHAVAPK